MSFVWDEDITEGSALTTKAVVDEIRTNLDSIKDNEACVADKTTYIPSQNTSDDTNHDTTHHTDENTGVNSGYNSGYDVDEHSTYQNDHNSGVDTGDNATYHNDENVSEDAPHNSSVDSSYDSGVLSVDNDTHRSVYHTNDRNDHRNGVYYTQDSAEYTDFYMPHYASEYVTYYGGVHSDHHYGY